MHSVKATPGDAGRSNVVEEAKEVYAENALLIFANFEKSDSGRVEILDKALSGIKAIAGQQGVETIVLNPFAHLFAEPLELNEAKEMLDRLYGMLAENGFAVQRLSFGIYYTLELRAKGHELARIARSIT